MLPLGFKENCRQLSLQTVKQRQHVIPSYPKATVPVASIHMITKPKTKKNRMSDSSIMNFPLRTKIKMSGLDSFDAVIFQKVFQLCRLILGQWAEADAHLFHPNGVERKLILYISVKNGFKRQIAQIEAAVRQQDIQHECFIGYIRSKRFVWQILRIDISKRKSVHADIMDLTHLVRFRAQGSDGDFAHAHIFNPCQINRV